MLRSIVVRCLKFVHTECAQTILPQTPRSLNNPTADTTMDLWNELDQMFISEDHHSTGGETSEFEDAQDSVPKDEKNCEDRLAVSPFHFVSEVFPRFYLAPILCQFRFWQPPFFI